MKKILVIIAASMLAAACAAPTNREATPATNTNSPAVTEVALTEAEATTKEKAIWDAIKNRDYDSFAAMLAPDQLEISPEGVMDKAGSIAGVKQFEPSDVNFSDWKYLPIGKDAFVVTYTVAVKAKFQGKEVPLQTAHASSAWVKRDGKWLAIYHQECEAAKPPPAGKSETAAPSPAATPAAPPATGADPIANEKIVWDLFKSKNYDAFAELLAPDFIEVEPDAYYDRAGAKKGVSMFDASKVVLSDFQAASLTPDAALVVYTAKGPAPAFSPAGQRHSSIWVKRDGKWLALLHHGGTPVRKASPPPAPSLAAKAPEKTKTP